jgi:hypothetical protein
VRTTSVVAATAAGLLLALAAPSVSLAAAPQDRNDPCSHAGRDTCGTTGVGSYEVYRYGRRWFGDYRGAVPGARQTFCLDLRFWYAAPRYRYRRAPAAGLRNRDGAAVPLERQQELAYAIWTFGRTAKPSRQAAVMLYVHSRMGDARPGEIDPAALGPQVAALYRRIDAAASRYHGPYRIEARLPAALTVGKQTTAAIRVLSSSGHPLPHLRLALSATGASGLTAKAQTNAAGVARVTLTPTAVAGLGLRVQTAAVAATRPHVFAATTTAARANAQRLAAPASQQVTSTVSRTDVAASPQISTQVSAQETVPGQSISDTVKVTGLGGASVTVQVELWGPYASRGEITCTGKPYWTGSFVAAGDSTTTTTPVRLDRSGYYTYRESIAAKPPSPGVVTPCGDVTETTFAKARPALSTVVSDQVVRPGSTISDRVRVQGLGSTPATIEVELYGPFGSRSAIRCTAKRLYWKGQVAVKGDSEVTTPQVKLARAGFYGYRERLIGSPLVAAAATPCAPAAETSLAAPAIVTGRGSVTTFTAAHDAGKRAPVRVRIASLGIDAPVAAAAIDLAHGALGIPTNIHRTGWWRDGMTPGAAKGSVLIAGHRDSAQAGAGVFFRLGGIGAGDEVLVDSAAGRTFTYRVVSVRSYPKSALPTSIYSSTGAPRLVLVTCGGPFDAASGHYRDNILVTATPTR